MPRKLLHWPGVTGSKRKRGNSVVFLNRSCWLHCPNQGQTAYERKHFWAFYYFWRARRKALIGTYVLSNLVGPLGLHYQLFIVLVSLCVCVRAEYNFCAKDSQKWRGHQGGVVMNTKHQQGVSRCTLPTSKYWITVRRGFQLPAPRLPTEQIDPHVSGPFQKRQSLAEPCQSCMSVQKQGLHHNWLLVTVHSRRATEAS